MKEGVQEGTGFVGSGGRKRSEEKKGSGIHRKSDSFTPGSSHWGLFLIDGAVKKNNYGEEGEIGNPRASG